MNQLRRLGAATLALASVAFASCSDDETAGVSSSAETAASTPPTIDSTATTTGPTVPETTADPTTSSSSTSTTAPPTTIDELAATRDAIEAAAVQSREDYLYAVRNFDAPDAVSVLSRTHAADSPSLQLGLDNMETLRTNGWRSRANPDVPSTVTVESDVQFLDGPPATRAELTTCVVSSGVVYEPAAAPDGSDVIVNDDIVARRNRITMVLEDGAWKLFEGVGLGEWEDATSCPDE